MEMDALDLWRWLGLPVIGSFPFGRSSNVAHLSTSKSTDQHALGMMNPPSRMPDLCVLCSSTRPRRTRHIKKGWVSLLFRVCVCVCVCVLEHMPDVFRSHSCPPKKAPLPCSRTSAPHPHARHRQPPNRARVCCLRRWRSWKLGVIRSSASG